MTAVVDTVQERTIARAIAAGREAYASRCDYHNQWSGNAAMMASGDNGGLPWPVCSGLREFIEWAVDQGNMPLHGRSLETALGWLEPMNDAARKALAAEFARLGTWREELDNAREAQRSAA